MIVLFNILITLILILFITGISCLGLASYNASNEKLVDRCLNIAIIGITLGAILTLTMLVIKIWI